MSRNAACDSTGWTVAQSSDNKEPIWIMLLISSGTGPFSVAVCPWSVCGTAIDKRTPRLSSITEKGMKCPNKCICLSSVFSSLILHFVVSIYWKNRRIWTLRSFCNLRKISANCNYSYQLIGSSAKQNLWLGFPCKCSHYCFITEVQCWKQWLTYGRTYSIWHLSFRPTISAVCQYLICR